MKARFINSKQEAKNISTYYFKPKKPMRQIAGQFTELYLPHNIPDSRGDHRWFTLSNSPTEQLLSITTKFFPGKHSTFMGALKNMKPGSQVALAEPMGDFVLPKNQETPLLFVAAGIGCTPYRSILKYLQDTREFRDIKLIYAAAELNEILFKDLFDQLKNKFKIVLSNPPSNWHGMRGELSANLIFNEITSDKQLIFLSGPENFVEKIAKDLIALGIKNSRIQTDYFPGYKTI